MEENDDFKQWLERGILGLEKERDYNEQHYQKDKICYSGLFVNNAVYTSMILQLKNVLKKYEELR